MLFEAFVQKAIEPLDITSTRHPAQTQLLRLMHLAQRWDAGWSAKSWHRSAALVSGATST
jgi:hypothetical protein